MNVKRSLVLVLIFLLGSVQVNSQIPGKWRIGRYGGLNFSNGTSIFQYNDTLRNIVSISSMWDSSGELIFFSNGVTVWDSSFTPLPGGDLFNTFQVPNFGANIPYCSVIIPNPGSNNEYIIFHENYVLTPNPSFQSNVTLYYSIIDRNLNGGMGDFTAVKNVPLRDSLWYGGISAVKHGNGRDWWIVSGKQFTTKVYTWLVQPDTILGPYIQDNGLMYSYPTGLWQTNFSEDGEWYAIAYRDVYTTGPERRLLLSRFDRCTGQLYDTLVLTNFIPDSFNLQTGVVGCAFSKSGRFLYVSAPTYMYQFDLHASDINASSTIVGVHDHLQIPFTSSFNFLKLAPDDRIYSVTGNGNWAMETIHFPDSSGLACQVELRNIFFPGGGPININVMPNYPNYELGPLVGSPCDTITGVSEFHSDDSGISIYPNPSTGSFSVQLPTDATGKARFELLDLLGREIFEQKINRQSTTQIISLPVDIANGVYVCRVVTDGKVYSEKLVLER